jgi:hypothetical protein
MVNKKVKIKNRTYKMIKSYLTRLSLSFLLLQGVATHACEPSGEVYRYAQSNEQLFYESIMPGEKKGSIITKISGVNLKQFHRIIKNSRNEDPWLDGMRFNNDPNYFTDGQRVFWQGEIVTSSLDALPVNATSFTQPFEGYSFAADKHNIYFQGKRSDDNTAENKINIKKIKRLDEYILSDGVHLYHNGKYIGVAKGYKVIQTKGYGNGASCQQGVNIIARNIDSVFVDGVRIKADADSFSIKRWMPNTLLDYHDKNGVHTYAYGANAAELSQTLNEKLGYISQGFFVGRTTVSYTKSRNKITSRWQLVTIPNINPEDFKQLSNRVGTDGKKLYVLNGKMDDSSPLQLSVITLDASTEISEPIIEGSKHLYFINETGVQVFEKYGKFITLSDYFAYDNAYVYVFDSVYKAAQRFKTADVKQVKLEDNNYAYSKLLTAEGKYETDGTFTPMNIKALRYFDADYATDGHFVYFQDQRIKGADASSFKTHTGIPMDKNLAYYYGRPLIGSDVKTLTEIDHGYFKDKASVFFGSDKIIGADVKTFQVLPLGDRWAKDARQVYYGEKVLPPVDITSFKQINHDYAKDKNHVYYENKLVKDADVASFKVKGDDAFDKSHHYKQGVMVTKK